MLGEDDVNLTGKGTGILPNEGGLKTCGVDLLSRRCRGTRLSLFLRWRGNWNPFPKSEGSPTISSSDTGRELFCSRECVIVDCAGLVVVACTVVSPADVDATGGVVMVTVTIEVANFVALTTVHIRVSYRFPDDVALAMVLDGGTVTCRLSWWSLSRLAGTARARLPWGRPRAWGMLASKMEIRNWVENCILKKCCTCSDARDDEKERASDRRHLGRDHGGFM